MTSDIMPSTSAFCKTWEDIFRRGLQSSAWPQGPGALSRAAGSCGSLVDRSLMCQDRMWRWISVYLRGLVFGSFGSPYWVLFPLWLLEQRFWPGQCHPPTCTAGGLRTSGAIWRLQEGGLAVAGHCCLLYVSWSTCRSGSICVVLVVLSL